MPDANYQSWKGNQYALQANANRNKPLLRSILNERDNEDFDPTKEVSKDNQPFKKAGFFRKLLGDESNAFNRAARLDDLDERAGLARADKQRRLYGDRADEAAAIRQAEIEKKGLINERLKQLGNQFDVSRRATDWTNRFKEKGDAFTNAGALMKQRFGGLTDLEGVKAGNAMDRVNRGGELKLDQIYAQGDVRSGLADDQRAWGTDQAAIKAKALFDALKDEHDFKDRTANQKNLWGQPLTVARIGNLNAGAGLNVIKADKLKQDAAQEKAFLNSMNQPAQPTFTGSLLSNPGVALGVIASKLFGAPVPSESVSQPTPVVIPNSIPTTSTNTVTPKGRIKIDPADLEAYRNKL